ncbi:hypothetical protein [Chitinimonas sp. BJB300]|uniref:hypothetical protein n=1 Tax=Chitinimonas sp. BJB300 TaxID=1559339 RepID=UPI000C0E2E22|nr:hypothetical protein [Chitinimonas sp. BJB300]PHV10536.1 hypothetical protein CSQ89_15740 [Chitinimonas sp. BJB300]TSJ85230.1 hypothetical protein FG002_018190 [Chitinimonas sp. BJB300]
MPKNSRPRKKQAPKTKAPRVVSPFDVMAWIKTPVSVLTKLMATGNISHDEMGSLICYVRIIEGNAHHLGIPCPNSAAICGLIKQINAGMPIYEERIEAALKWVRQSAKWLRGRPANVTALIIEEIQAEIQRNILIKEIKTYRPQLLDQKEAAVTSVA